MSKILVLLFLHILGDALFHGKKLRKLKVERISYLFAHVGLYTFIMLVFTPFLLGITFMQSLVFSLFNGVMHFVVDYIGIKIKMKYWKTNQYKFVAIDSMIEQFLHVTILIGSFIYMFPRAIDFANWYNVVMYYFLERPI